MKISLDWLREYIHFDFTAEELADRLTMVGLEVEEINESEPLVSGIVVGKIIGLENHPTTNKLKVCRVDVGDEVLSIVCGAPNVGEGQLVPVAKVDAVLAEGTTVKTAKIRGVRSEGMICSERELDVGDDHSGVLLLDRNGYSVGDNFFDKTPKKDAVLEINVTPNRPDCLGYMGIAREVGVIVGERMIKPDAKVMEGDTPVEEWVSVEILDPIACPRYCARIISDVKVESSPKWLRTRLESVGVRSINNVVDVTNYVLMETGQPLHGFDYDLLQGQKIVVRKAEEGEVFVTLDEEKRTFKSEDLLICDAERGVALAGIMGGLNSEVSDSTQSVLLESAYFDPMTVRRTAKRLGMSTEASQRFERGADPNNTIYAIDRAAKLLSDVAGGKVARGVVDVYPRSIEPWEISLRRSRISTILGSDIPRKSVFSILRGLDLKVKEEDPLRVTVPTFRPDLMREIDLIEEIIRHYGYEKIEPNLHSYVPLIYSQNGEEDFVDRVRDILVGLGFLETMNISLVSKEHVSMICDEIQPVAIRNPLSPETTFLRTSLVPNLLDSIRWNNNRSSGNLRLFEIGTIFSARAKTLPSERLFVAGILTGFVKSNPFWGVTDEKVNFFHLKGVVENLLESLHVTGYEFESERVPTFRSETSMTIRCGKGNIGLFGEMEKNLLDQWDIQNEVFIFEIPVDGLRDNSSKTRYTPIPKFPSVRRDLAIVVDEKVPVSSLKKLIRKVGGKKLISAELFDLYQGQQIPPGKKSTAFSLTFMSPTRTLKEEEVDPIISAILKELEASFSACLRM